VLDGHACTLLRKSYVRSASRAKDEARALAERRALKRQRTELQNLPELVSEVGTEESAAEARRLRRQVRRPASLATGQRQLTQPATPVYDVLRTACCA
jgi:hypothetical protein